MEKVSIIRCNDYNIESLTKALKASFDNLGGIKKFIKPGAKIVLKANLLMKKKPEDAATTHPAFIQALAYILKEEGAQHITLIDSPGGPYTKDALRGIYNVCGMGKMAQETEIQLNYDTSGIEIDNPDGKYLKKLKVLKPLLDADLIINLPKLKSHAQMVYTGAVKNMFGAIPGESKVMYHLNMSNYYEFADSLIDIYLSVKPKLSIMDAVIGMDGNGPSAGLPKDIGLILASENAFLLDFTALNIVYANPMSIPVIKCAIDRNLCPTSIDKIELVGEKIEDVKIKDFNFPQRDTLKDIQFIKNSKLKSIIGKFTPKPIFNESLCVKCGICVKSCPPKALEIKEEINKPIINLSKCIRCFCCQELCPAKAISIKRYKLVDKFVKFAAYVGTRF